jgi:hypothetical protein
MLKFEIRNIIVDKEILGEDVLELVNNFGDDTVNMREIFVHIFLQNRWKKSDVLHNIKFILYLKVTPK